MARDSSRQAAANRPPFMLRELSTTNTKRRPVAFTPKNSAPDGNADCLCFAPLAPKASSRATMRAISRSASPTASVITSIPAAAGVASVTDPMSAATTDADAMDFGCHSGSSVIFSGGDSKTISSRGPSSASVGALMRIMSSVGRPPAKLNKPSVNRTTACRPMLMIRGGIRRSPV